MVMWAPGSISEVRMTITRNDRRFRVHQPANPPIAEAGTDRDRSRKAQEFRFESHGVSAVTWAFPLRQPGISAADAADGRHESSSRAVLEADRAAPIRAIQVRPVPPKVPC